MLLVTPPNTIKEKSVDTNFWLWLKVGTKLQCDYRPEEKASAVLYLVFGEVPGDDNKALDLFEACLDFYNCGHKDRGVPAPNEQLIDWEYDSPTIWADFKMYANIDLDEMEYIHWWEFYSLFQSLPPHSRIKELIGIRSEDLNDYSGKGQEKIREKKRHAKIMAAIEYTDNEDY